MKFPCCVTYFFVITEAEGCALIGVRLSEHAYKIIEMQFGNIPFYICCILVILTSPAKIAQNLLLQGLGGAYKRQIQTTNR